MHGLERTLHTYPDEIVSGEYVNGRHVEGEPLTIFDETKLHPAPNTHLGIRRLQTEFAMGFGKRMLSVSKVESNNAGIEVHCDLDPKQCSCPSSVTRVTALLQLSDDLIVRSAVITTDYIGGKGRRELRVSNSGFFPLERAGITIAQEGNVEELLMQADDNGVFQRVDGGEVFNLVVSSVEMDLTATRYQELSEIDSANANAIVGLTTDGRHPNSSSANEFAMWLPISLVVVGTLTLLLLLGAAYFRYIKRPHMKAN